MKHRLPVVLALLLPVLVGASSSPAATVEPGRPALVLVISVDQMRSDYLLRFHSNYTGGLRWLWDHGVVFENAFHNHAITETGPGHSVILTGLNPAHTGIIANQWYDRERRLPVYCVEDVASPILGDALAAGRSPRNLKVQTLGDRLKVLSPESKMVSLSGKDRAAILMGGQHPDQVYWFDSVTGRMVTSEYYEQRYPEWLQAVNARRIPASYFGKVWNYLKPGDAFYSQFGKDDVAAENDPAPTFPHAFGPTLFVPTTATYTAFTQTPFFDEFILSVARAAILEEKLGKRGATDLLALGLSATDYIGHTYGPQSQEMADQLLRLDKSLGEFFQELDQRIGLDKVVIALTSDHGVLPLAGQREGTDGTAARLTKDQLLRFQGLNAALSKKFGKEENWLSYYTDGDLYFNYPAITGNNLRRSDVETAVKDYLWQSPGIAAVFGRSDLEKAPPSPNATLDLVRNGFHPGLSGDIEIQFAEYLIPTIENHGTGHGTLYRYDRWVPLVFYGPGWKPHRVAEEVHITDLAPTLAEALKLPPAAQQDGVSRLGALRP